MYRGETELLNCKIKLLSSSYMCMCVSHRPSGATCCCHCTLSTDTVPHNNRATINWRSSRKVTCMTEVKTSKNFLPPTLPFRCDTHTHTHIISSSRHLEPNFYKYKYYRVTSQKSRIFINTAVRSWNVGWIPLVLALLLLTQYMHFYLNLWH